MVLTYENEADFEENMVFQVDNLDEVKSMLEQCTTKNVKKSSATF
jgi:hypothetical protein